MSAISVQAVSKAYRIGVADDKYETLTAAAMGWLRTPLKNYRRLRSLNTFGKANSLEDAGVHWALRDVSFEVAEGDVVGIVGRNGAGKSTLLKILSRITDPTEGRAIIRGRVSSLLEVGTGFHPELSGRENIYMNGTILGMRKREIDQKFDQIVDFSGIEKFIDTPVKRFSSGMKVRLAFAVAAHLEPEILVIDEVLAVGDQEFQNKCLGKMNDVSKSGRTVLFVSHNLAAVRALCNKGVLLKDGKVATVSDTASVLQAYQNEREQLEYNKEFGEDCSRVIDRRRVLRRMYFTDDAKRSVECLMCGAGFTVHLDLKGLESRESLVIGLHFYDEIGQRVMTFHSGYQHAGKLAIADSGAVECHCETLQLSPGRYRIVAGIVVNGDQVERFDPATSVEVIASDFYGTGKSPSLNDGVFWPKVSWRTVE